MSGAVWSLLAGVGFGVFQSLNRQAVRGMDIYVSTFLQLLVSAIVLIGISLLTQDISAAWQAGQEIWLFFILAGFFHFFIGWTFLNASQKRIGAARTGSLIGTTPLFAAVLAAFTLAEIPTWATVLGIFTIVIGVYLVNSARAADENAAATRGIRSLLPGLAAAVCWSISPIFIRYGLEGLPSPILGVTVGITASALAYGFVLLYRRLTGNLGRDAYSLDAARIKIAAAVLVGLSTWMRWEALDLTAVATVLALSLVSVPVVNLLAPMISGRDLERVTSQVWAGSGLIVAGSLILIFL
jgi:drug/metabolite transporter (DMT)-like permease